MNKALIITLAFIGEVIAASTPNHITKSNYTNYTKWNKDHFSYYALNQFNWDYPVNDCHRGSGNCNIATVNGNEHYTLEGKFGNVYTLSEGNFTINPRARIDTIYYDISKTNVKPQTYSSLDASVGTLVKNFTTSKWRSKGMPTSASELPFTIDTITANYPLKNSGFELKNQYDTLKTSYNGKSIRKVEGNLYIPAGEYYFDKFDIIPNFGKKIKVKLLDPRKATIIHVKNGSTWQVYDFINRASASDPDLFTHLDKSLLFINHGTNNITINNFRGSIVAPYSKVIVDGYHSGNAIAKDIETTSKAKLYYTKFNPTSW